MFDVEALEAELRIRAARWLESGPGGTSVLLGVGPLVRVLARVNAPIASHTLRRPASIPPGLRVVTVGGATLGGSGKSRVAMACVEALTQRGSRVALIGHAYRARPGSARFVQPEDRLAEVGDEALAAARRFARLGIDAPVIVAPSRDAALARAATSTPALDAVVLDGPLQLRPEPASLALLAVDAAAPWGSGEVFPAGDLRAPQHVLRSVADEVVEVNASPRAFIVANEEVGAESLCGARIGLFTALARPDRLVRALALLGLSPAVVVACPDHGPLTAEAIRRLQAAEPSVDTWVATEKCAVHLDGVKLERPLAVLEASVSLPEQLLARISAIGGPVNHQKTGRT
ncbi:Tetraacyldisaccharide 4'-kinase [Labilithrix luteola]|uniref:Tetraacyldisaccharide 4'-kinase n=1 Tax=Labilithrix luteola TaxID=1391654 RepID=A0A0K1PYG6_9BACT|nr:Tetraacyldisaccharide 4'-kinase [Labilithrix luteola]